MLQELSIRHFAIIDSLELSFDKGLTVLTGETGAGKSIIIDALQLLTGGRGSGEFVRHGEKKAEIEGMFTIHENHPCHQLCREFGIDVEEEAIILRREISSNGKSVCRANGKMVTLSILREIGARLMDIHGQHEHQELMNAGTHLRLLDDFGGTAIYQAKEKYKEVYSRYEHLQTEIRRLSENEQNLAHRLDLIQFQLNEIQKAELTAGEEEKLESERQQLANFEKLYGALSEAYGALSGDGKALDWLGISVNGLESAAGINRQYKALHEAAANSFYVLEDTVRDVSSILDTLEFDPARLNEIESRLNEINQLKRKYGSTIEDILQYGEKIAEEIDQLTHRETHISRLQKEMVELEAAVMTEGKKLSKLRSAAAGHLEEAIHRELKELYMEKTVFKVHFQSETGQYKKDGIDQVEFYMTTNPGEPLKPLVKVASGGEMSRVMLAMKTIFSKHQGVTSIIFDEVDTGVSGRVAQAIGEKIYKIAVHSQVLCISHLPQVAAMADSHLYIQKNQDSKRTSTLVTPLNDDEKASEIGRMISGVEMTDLTKEHAKELLALSAKLKQSAVLK
ncbi:DNA repair protein RecN [Domibacillus epiphyticus]|uniref:DNA repair protein RecN n=1 Tax=Domibacillus epiphyticus TaxID=1714355 RepID=A0A1V2A9P0_9BACI|nr:DNA repair protein RecN [Domibacillus epiphyticus]OMP67719.1 DNA repair protein RecN [Domibacillus epiphyticus]